MTIFQTQGPAPASFLENSGPRFDPQLILGILKGRLLAFAIPYLLVLICGAVVIQFQRPIYRSEGKILVESPEIPPDLVRPTVTEVAYERVQVIQQRIMARDNLMAVINKYSLFPRQRDSMSGTELLELIRSRTEIRPVELSAQSSARPTNPTIAFTLSFEYEDATAAMNVANEFLTSILREDARARNKDAAGTTQFLELEVKRLEGEHEAVIEQIVSLQKRPAHARSASGNFDKVLAEDDLKQKKKMLSALEAELAQKAAVYSDEHPVMRNLTRNIASIKRQIAAAPKPAAIPDAQADDDPGQATDEDATGGRGSPANADVLVLTRQESNLQKSLAEATQKLIAARLGETMERNQQGERLQVIEQPSLPQKPVRPNKLKWLAGVFAVALVAGALAVLLSELLDSGIRGGSDLSNVVARDLVVTIPYMSNDAEDRRGFRRMIAIGFAVLIVSMATAGVTVATGVALDTSWLNRTQFGGMAK